MLGLPLLLPLAGVAWAAAEPAGVPDAPPAVVAHQPVSVDLGEAIRMALDRQPTLAAQRSTLASAEANSRGLDNLRVPTFLVRELPIRRKQASIGVTVAAASLEQAEHETVYAVTRTYLTVLYAREQQRVANDVVDHLKATLETARRLVEGGSRDVTTSSVDKITVYLRLAETRQADAAAGIERATAALREAIGLGPDCCLQVPPDRLPQPRATLCRGDIVALALARRGELVQAVNVAEVTALEVDAQGTSCRPNFHTFASVADIHARPIPQGVANAEYRPGAIGPEMPTNLAGSRSARMERARDLSARAEAVVEKTRNLIALEAEDAFLRWEQAARKMPQTREAAERGSKLADDTRKDFGGEQRVKAEDVLNSEVLAAQARAQFNEAVYQHAVALAALERVTAGGFCAGFAGPAAAPAQAPAPTNGQLGVPDRTGD
jgi:outer membrane protein TolC